MAEILTFIVMRLQYFMGCFPSISYCTFVVLVMGFLARSDQYGVTSVVRALDLHPTKYDTLLEFFRSPAVNLGRMWEQWWKCVLDSGNIHKTHGKYNLVGDDTSMKSCGKKTPGVTKLVNYSEGSDKDTYFWGMYWGSVGAICDKPGGYYCIPLHMCLQVGLNALKDWLDPNKEGQERLKDLVEKRVKSHIEQMIENAYDIAKTFGESILILDRFYMSSTLLQTMKKLNTSKHLLDCVMRVRMNLCAYDPPPPPDPHKRGPKPKKGKKKYVLRKLFDDIAQFTEAEVLLYGKTEKIFYRSLDLVWGRKVWMPLRFVFTIRPNGGKSIFASTDLGLSPLEIVEAYSRRYKIELAFRSIKQIMAGLKARFWSKVMPVLNKYAKKDDPSPLSKVTSNEDREKILDTLEAHERFAAISCIALGIAQMIAATPKFASVVRGWRWLRTLYPGDTVSEETVSCFIGAKLKQLLLSDPENRIAEIIREYQQPPRARWTHSRGA